MADDAGLRIGFVLVFFDEILRAGKGDLGDVFFDFILRHTDAVIRDGQSFSLWVYLNLNAAFFLPGISLADGVEALQLLDSIAGVRHQLSQKNVFIRIKPFFNNRKYFFRLYFNLSFAGHIHSSVSKEISTLA